MNTWLKTDSRLNISGNFVLFFECPVMRMLPSILMDSSRILNFWIFDDKPLVVETVGSGKCRIRHGRDNDVKMSLFIKKMNGFWYRFSLRGSLLARE